MERVIDDVPDVMVLANFHEQQVIFRKLWGSRLDANQFHRNTKMAMSRTFLRECWGSSSARTITAAGMIVAAFFSPLTELAQQKKPITDDHAQP